MKPVLLAAIALVSVPALAQTVAPPPASGAGQMSQRVQSRADVAKHVERLFARFDTNHDGVLDQAELAAASNGRGGKHDKGEAAMGDSASAPRQPLDRNAVFDQIDTDHDGTISRDEFARAPTPGRHMGMHDGSPGKGGGEKGRGGGMARLFAMADANRDGRVTLKEATDAALRQFDMADTNHDGQLTPDERMAARAARGSMRGQ